MNIEFKGRLCRVVLSKYESERPEIRLLACDDGSDIAQASVDLPRVGCPEGHTFIKDWSENKGMLRALINAGIVEDTTIRVATGFVEAALVSVLAPHEAAKE